MSDKELQERCLDNLFLEELPFKIPVTFKEGIKEKYYSGKCGCPREVTIRITTFKDIAWDAKHYYGRIEPESPPIYEIGDKSLIEHFGYLGADTELFDHNRFDIDLMRPTTKEEKEEFHNKCNPLTSGWLDKEELISFAKEVFKRRFGEDNGWKLELIDYTKQKLELIQINYIK